MSKHITLGSLWLLHRNSCRSSHLVLGLETVPLSLRRMPRVVSLLVSICTDSLTAVRLCKACQWHDQVFEHVLTCRVLKFLDLWIIHGVMLCHYFSGKGRWGKNALSWLVGYARILSSSWALLNNTFKSSWSRNRQFLCWMVNGCQYEACSKALFGTWSGQIVVKNSPINTVTSRHLTKCDGDLQNLREKYWLMHSIFFCIWLINIDNGCLGVKRHLWNLKHCSAVATPHLLHWERSNLSASSHRPQTMLSKNVKMSVELYALLMHAKHQDSSSFSSTISTYRVVPAVPAEQHFMRRQKHHTRTCDIATHGWVWLNKYDRRNSELTNNRWDQNLTPQMTSTCLQ